MSEETGTSRADAIARGLKFYMGKRACINGNLAPRYVSGNCTCEPCRLAGMRRTQQWKKRPENRDRQREGEQRRSERRKDKVAAYREANKDKIIARVKEWQRNNRERVNAATKRWAQANPDIKRAAFDRRQEAVKRARPAWWSRWDVFVMQEALHLAKLRTEVTGIEWQRDHMVPLQGPLASGLHCAANIQVIPAALNRWKNSRLLLTEPGEWIKHI